MHFPCYNVNNATGLRPAGRRPQAPCSIQAPEGLDPRPAVRYSRSTYILNYPRLSPDYRHQGDFWQEGRAVLWGQNGCFDGHLGTQEGAKEQHYLMRKVQLRGVNIFMVVVKGSRGHWLVNTC